MLKNIKSKLKKGFNRKTLGGINQILAVAVLVVILLVVEWPTVKTVITTTWTTISTWFSTNLAKVFTNLP